MGEKRAKEEVVRYPEFGRIVRAAMKEKGLSIADLTKPLSIGYEMARRYYNGIARPRTGRAQKLGVLIGVSAARLLEVSELSEPSPTPGVVIPQLSVTGIPERKLFFYYQSIDEKARAILLAVGEALLMKEKAGLGPDPFEESLKAKQADQALSGVTPEDRRRQSNKPHIALHKTRTKSRGSAQTG